MKFTCPCCGYQTLPQPANGSYNLCEVCYWEDDGVQLNDPDYEGGANSVGLRQAQLNFLTFGASEEVFVTCVRPPGPDEPKDAAWQLLDQL